MNTFCLKRKGLTIINTEKPIKEIVILGGGSAGWLTAGLLAANHLQNNHLQKNQLSKITLIESPDVKPIGVGEGTWPTMRATLLKIGISEADLIRECDASFKQGSKFSAWVTSPQGNAHNLQRSANSPQVTHSPQVSRSDSYYHPFSLPHNFGQINLAPHWQPLRNKVSFADAVTPQGYLCAQGLAPKQQSMPEYAFVTNYGYHLDAGKFSQLVQKHCVEKLGVTHVIDHVVKVNSSSNGDISSLSTKMNGNIQGDLFIDCSGLSSLLIGQHYQIPFINKKDILFNDSALAVQVPYDNELSPIASHTLSTAQNAGWIWDIGLSSRRGVGHVYSSAHSSDDKAEKALRDYLKLSVGDKAESLTVRKFSINPGHRKEFWHKNCVAVGMASGFLEPLEASALMLIELSANMISEQLPANRKVMDIVAKRFNEKFTYHWNGIVDFLKLHYILSQRTDSAYWLDNRQAESIPDSLQELISLWQYHSPWHNDFDRKDEIFSAASYQYVLYGMGFNTESAGDLANLALCKNAEQCFNDNNQLARKLLKALPTNRELITHIKQFGM